MRSKALNVKQNIINTQTICKVLFFFCVILNAAFGESPEWNRLSKVFIFAFMSMALLHVLIRRTLFLSWGVVQLILTFIFFVASALWSENLNNPFQSIFTLFQLLLLCFFIVEVFAECDICDTYFFALYVAGFFVAIITLYQYGAANFFTALQAGERMGGSLANENTFGLVFAYALVSGVYIYFYRWQNILILVGCIPHLVFSLSSGSKKAIIAIVAGVIAILWIKFGIKRLYKFLLISIAAIAALYFILNLPIFATMQKRLFSFLEGGTNFSDSVRKNMRETGMALFWSSPLLGHGLNAFEAISGFNVYSHCNFTELLANGGIIGFVLYYSIFGYLFVRLLPFAGGKRGSAVMLLVLNGLRVLLDYGMVSYTVKSVWILIGVTLSGICLLRKERTENDFEDLESNQGAAKGDAIYLSSASNKISFR